MIRPPLIFSASCASLDETQRFARRFAGILGVGDVVALAGTLGAGKTAFARAVIRAFVQSDIDVPSPTYNLLLTYEANDITLYHYDLYRLEKPEDAFELDIDEAFEDGVSLIEWPDRLGRYLPADHLRVEIEPTAGADSEERTLTFYGGENWRQRLAPLREARNA